MKRFTKYLVTAILCAAIMLGVIIPAAPTVKAAVISGKTGIGMAEWAWRAYNEGWVYKYGGSSAGAVDCSGLIRSYCNGKGGGAKALLDASSVKGNMNTIPRIHGLGLWLDGHAGVYVGRTENGVDMAIDSRNANKDMQYDEVFGNTWPVWVKWYKIDMVSYPDTGWYEYNGDTYYYHNGEFVVGYFTVDGVTYDFGKSGACKGVAPEGAVNTKTLTVTSNSVNVRTGAGSSYSKVTTASAGSRYTYTETKEADGETWYKIELSSSKTGWISGNYVRPDQQTATESTAPTVTEKRLKVTGSTVNVRKGAGTSYSKVTTASKNDEYVYTDSAKASDGVTWYKITLSSTSSGWICGTYVDIIEINIGSAPTTGTTSATDAEATTTEDATTTEPTSTTTEATSTTTTTTTTATTAAAQNKVKVTGSTVNVRKGAGTGYSVVTTVKKGATYVYTDTKKVSGKTWYKITVGSKTGWIIGTYVTVIKATTAATTTTTVPTTTTTTAATTTTTAAAAAEKKLQVTGSPVNVRSGAGTSYSKVTKVDKGQVYTYTDTKKVGSVTWYKITVGSKTGWIMGTFVKVLPTTTTVATTESTTAANTTTITTTTTTKATTTTTVAAKKIKVTGKVVNVRKGAGTGYAVVTTVKKGATYVYTDTKTVSGKTWYKITVGSKTGWIIGTYVKKV